MIAQKRLEELAGEMLGRSRDGKPPFLLFLGSACLRTATERYRKEIMEGFLQEVKKEPVLREVMSSVKDWNEVLLKLRDHVPSPVLRRLLYSVFHRIPIPSFYQDLAVMVRQGFFREILTTNFDTLLEQALDATGMRRGAEYRVINFQKSDEKPNPSGSGVVVYKLKGDLGGQQFGLTAPRIDSALFPLDQDLRQDLLVVGYEGEAESINPWFAKGGGGEVWWIAENIGPADKILHDIGELRELHVLDGRYASPEWFFQQLFQLVIKSQLDGPFEFGREDASGSGGPVWGESWRLDPKIALRNEIEKAKNVLANVMQAQATSSATPDLDAQLAYQKEWIEKMERELASLEAGNAGPSAIVDEILRSLQPDPQDRLKTTFEQQLSLLKDEWLKPKPNQQLVNTMLNAAIVLGDQFGERLVGNQYLGRLKSLAGEFLK
jgi:hypothetical protein